MARVRTRDFAPFTNTYQYGTYINEQYGFQAHDYCSDGLGIDTDHPLSLYHIVVADCNFQWNGTFQGTGSLGYLSPYPAPADPTTWLSQFTAQRIAAATAPERAKVYALTDFLEWRDVPRMLKHAGDLLLGLRNLDLRFLTSPETLASSILAYQFGWGPLLQDLSRLVDFGSQVDQRIKEIGALNSGKTLRRTVKFGSTESSASGKVTVHSIFGIYIEPWANVSSKTQCWATIRWQLRDLHNLGRVPTWWWAFRSVYGLDPKQIVEQVWKALPWSWMIDWFANLSEALIVSRNLITYEPSRINKMWETTINVDYRPLHPRADRNFSGGSLTRVEKHRSQPSISGVTGVHLKVPFLDTFKLSVLSALTILSIRRGLR